MYRGKTEDGGRATLQAGQCVLGTVFGEESGVVVGKSMRGKGGSRVGQVSELTSQSAWKGSCRRQWF